MTSLRLITLESFDSESPFFKWVSPTLRKMGWAVWPIPSVTLYRLLGIQTYRALIVNLVKEIRPQILLLTPPYDYLDLKTASEIKKLGVIIWGYGFDEQDYCQLGKPDNLRHNSKIFDLWTTSVLNGKSRDYGARPICWATCKESLLIDDQSAPASPIVFFGRKTRERELLVETLRKSTIVLSFGQGWTPTALSRASRLGLIRRAECTIVANDTQISTPLTMVECAMLGKAQIVEETPHMNCYWETGVKVPTYDANSINLEQLNATRTTKIWKTPPAWNELWPNLTDTFQFSPKTLFITSPTYDMLMNILTNHYLGISDYTTLLECLETWAKLSPLCAEPQVKLSQCAFILEKYEKVLEHSHQAKEILENNVAPNSPYTVTSFPPIIKVVAMRIRALLLLKREPDIYKEIETMPLLTKQNVLNEIRTELEISKQVGLIDALKSN